MNNIHNIQITEKFITDLVYHYTGIKIQINNINKFQKAFIHKSFWNFDSTNCLADNICCMDILEQGHNERLEFLGDKVIDVIVTEYLFDTYPEKDEGFLTKLKSRIVKKESLCKLGETLGFKKYIMISPHIEKINGRNNDRFMEDLFEAFIGVLYKDQNSDMRLIRKFVISIIQAHIDLDNLINNNDNFKDILMRYLHSISIKPASYQIISFKAEDISNKDFISVAYINNHIEQAINVDKTIRNLLKNTYNIDFNTEHMLLGIGEPKNTKKLSEQSAAYIALKNLNVSLQF
jgi:dsRNA-specific ribonuclease